MDDVRGRFLGLPLGTTPATKTSSFKSSENIQKKEGGPDRSVSGNQSSSVTLNELAMKARKPYCHFKRWEKLKRAFIAAAMLFTLPKHGHAIYCIV